MTEICKLCVLPDSFPGVRLDDEGVCQFCRTLPAERNTPDISPLEKIAPTLKKIRWGDEYQVLLALSGGKDSSYTLKLLREDLGLDVLAVTFDNGFISPQAIENIRAVTEILSTDHIMVSPRRGIMIRAFRESATKEIYSVKMLQRASSICNTCMSMVRSVLLRTAIEKRIPIIAYGWSPGQVPSRSSLLKLKGGFLKQFQDAVAGYLEPVIGRDADGFVLRNWHYQILSESGADLYHLNPLTLVPYDEEKVRSELRPLGWKDPADTDSNSTNCLLNTFANYAHQEQYGYHPYALEIANLVRSGHMTREAGLAKLNAAPDQEVLACVRQQLGINQREAE